VARRRSPVTDMTPAGHPAWRNKAVLLFLGSTFGLAAVLSLPISRFLPLPFSSPSIQAAEGPVERILRHLLPSSPSRNVQTTGHIQEALAGSALAGPGFSGHPAAGSGSSQPLPSRAGSPTLSRQRCMADPQCSRQFDLLQLAGAQVRRTLQVERQELAVAQTAVPGPKHGGLRTQARRKRKVSLWRTSVDTFRRTDLGPPDRHLSKKHHPARGHHPKRR